MKIQYTKKLDERLDELRRLYDTHVIPAGDIGWVGWKRESGSFSLYTVVNSSGGIRVTRSADTAGELLDYVEGLIDGTRAARADRGRLFEKFMN